MNRDLFESDLGWARPLGHDRGARISDCGRYRTLLWRKFGDPPPMVFVMLNPSTADGFADDPTIRRCIGFARREGNGGVVVVNLSPWRATDPRDLETAYRRGDDVMRTDENEDAFKTARLLGSFVLAWGAGFRPWMETAKARAMQIGRTNRCLGKTADGEPRHPLMLASHTPLIEFP